MALQQARVVCTSCGRYLDREGDLCQSCARKQYVIVTVFGLFLACVGAASYFYMHHGATRSLVVQDPAVVPPVTLKSSGGWLYFRTVDPLMDDATVHAHIDGNHPAPNGATVTGQLELSVSHRYGKRVVITFPHMKSNCPSRPCTLNIAVDSKPPETFVYDDISDDEKSIVSLFDFDRLRDMLKDAHDMTITPPFGKGDNTILTFTVTGFSPDELKQ